MKFKQLLEYEKLSHQPIDPNVYPDEVGRGDNIFMFAPKDLYKNAYNIYLNADSVSRSELKNFMDFLLKNQGKSDTKIKIYRGQPSDILEYGMWITPFKSYAMYYAYDGAYSDNPDSKVYEYTVTLHEISCDLNSLAEWGYFGKSIKGKEIKL